MECGCRRKQTKSLSDSYLAPQHTCSGISVVGGLHPGENELQSLHSDNHADVGTENTLEATQVAGS